MDALAWIPNDDLTRDEWVRVAYALFAATGGAAEGLDAFIAFSAQSTKHHNVETVVQRWESFRGSPPRGITGATLYGLAPLHGWPGWTPEPPATPDGYMDALARDERARAHASASSDHGHASPPGERGHDHAARGAGTNHGPRDRERDPTDRGSVAAADAFGEGS